jgi:hypothetical protein
MRPGSHLDSTDHMEKKRIPIPIPGADRGSSDIRGHYFPIRRLVPRLLAPMRTSILIPTTQQAVDVHVARVAEAARACRGNSKGMGALKWPRMLQNPSGASEVVTSRSW